METIGRLFLLHDIFLDEDTMFGLPVAPTSRPRACPTASRLLVAQQQPLAAAELPLSRGRPPKSPLRSWGELGTPTLKTLWSTMAGMASTTAPRELVPRVAST